MGRVHKDSFREGLRCGTCVLIACPEGPCMGRVHGGCRVWNLGRVRKGDGSYGHREGLACRTCFIIACPEGLLRCFWANVVHVFFTGKRSYTVVQVSYLKRSYTYLTGRVSIVGLGCELGVGV